jgi:hypothetical protein
MQVTVNIPDELAAQAREKGLSVETYVEEVLARQARERAKADRESVNEALDRISQLRRGNKLGGSRIKDMIQEGRKY